MQYCELQEKFHSETGRMWFDPCSLLPQGTDQMRRTCDQWDFNIFMDVISIRRLFIITKLLYFKWFSLFYVLYLFLFISLDSQFGFL